MGDFGKGLKNFKDQVKSNKSSDEKDLIDEIPEEKIKEKKSKSVKKKKTVKKKT